MSCSVPPLNHAAHLLLHLSLQNRKGKLLQNQCAPTQRLLLLQKGHCCPPAVPTLLLQSITLLNCVHLMAPLNSDNPWIQIIRNRKWMLNFFLKKKKTTVSKYFASKVILVKQYLPDTKPLKCLPFLRKLF